jgi:hypothetical protein
MPLRRRDVELSVERPVPPESGSGVVRLTARFEGSADGTSPEPRELAGALERLRAELDALIGPPLAAAPAARPDRPLTELVDTYRPRQRELVDLLREEGVLSMVEHARLTEYLSTQAASSTPPPARPSLSGQPIAAMPIAADRAPDLARPVTELLRAYQITTLRQAGAVRARRQISFDEYMALKRHFESGAAAPADRAKSDAPD